MPIPLIPIIMLGARFGAGQVLKKVTPQIAKRLIQAGKAKRASPAAVKVLGDKAASAVSKAPVKAAPKMGPKVKKTAPKKKQKSEMPEAAKKKSDEIMAANPKSKTQGLADRAIKTEQRRETAKNIAKEAGKAAALTGAGAGIGSLISPDKKKDKSMPTKEVKPAPKVREAIPLEISEARPSRKPEMPKDKPKSEEPSKPEGGFWQGIADVIAGGKGKGTVEYDYPDDDVDKKRGGMVYRMKGGKVGKATKRGTGKAMSGAYINYGKPMKEKMSSGGKVGMRGCGKALRGYGKAMKGK